MSRISNNTIVEMVKEITVAVVSGSNKSTSDVSAKEIANFMQVIYDKLSEFAAKDQ